jgi:cyclase
MDTSHLRTLRISRHLLAFYDGRIAGQTFAGGPNWVDDGALELGVCSYALVDGAEALVFDTHVSADHGRVIRRTLEGMGVRRITVVLSHWHLDHVAGTAAFADCEVIAGRLTAERLTGHRRAIEEGTLEGPPAISPLVLPTTVFEQHRALTVGGLEVELIGFDIHSADGTALWLAGERLLLAGDMLEDTVTYVSEPERLPGNLGELDRLRGLRASHIYPDHGSEAVIAGPGYNEGFILATQRYIADLLRLPHEPALAELDLRAFVAASLAKGRLHYFEPYERVHRNNVAMVMEAAGSSQTPAH